jgi:hypothetical protein
VSSFDHPFSYFQREKLLKFCQNNVIALQTRKGFNVAVATAAASRIANIGPYSIQKTISEVSKIEMISRTEMNIF